MRRDAWIALTRLLGAACGKQDTSPVPPSSQRSSAPPSAAPSSSSSAATSPDSPSANAGAEVLDLESIPEGLEEDAWRDRMKSLEGRLVTVGGCIDPKYRTGPRAMVGMACR